MTDSEKELADNLAKKANEMLHQGQDTQDVLNLVQAIATLKHN
jgi:cytochrome c-type biogenesis protein CcmH/NrfF